MKRIVLLVAVFVFAFSLAVPALVSVDATPASSDARLTNNGPVELIAWRAANPECPPAPWVGGGGGC